MSENPYAAPQAPEPTMLPPLPQVEKTAWNGWWTLLWAFALFMVWQVVLSICLGIAFALDGGIKGLTDPHQITELFLEMAMDGDVLGLSAFATIFAVCPLAWFIGKMRKGWGGWEYLGNDRVKWWHWPIWGLATLACNLAFSLIAPFFGIDGPDDSMMQMAQSTQVPLFLFLGVGIGAPLVEEFMFRGVLFRGWRESSMGLIPALLLTSFAWAILHVQYPAVLIGYIFVLGIVLGIAREKTGNIWIPIWMHALNNGLAVYGMLDFMP